MDMVFFADDVTHAAKQNPDKGLKQRNPFIWHWPLLQKKTIR
jgi:hypothetical protein